MSHGGMSGPTAVRNGGRFFYEMEMTSSKLKINH
jgi:hypothetical protein